MDTYIEEALDIGYIHPSTSLAASSLFFGGEKDGGLRPCIDYQPLKDLTIKNRFPLPAALEQVGQLDRLPSTPNWTYVVLTTWSISEVGMSGRRRSSPLGITTNTSPLQNTYSICKRSSNGYMTTIFMSRLRRAPFHITTVIFLGIVLTPGGGQNGRRKGHGRA
jgi:hypothetical protein